MFNRPCIEKHRILKVACIFVMLHVNGCAADTDPCGNDYAVCPQEYISVVSGCLSWICGTSHCDCNRDCQSDEICWSRSGGDGVCVLQADLPHYDWGTPCGDFNPHYQAGGDCSQRDVLSHGGNYAPMHSACVSGCCLGNNLADYYCSASTSSCGTTFQTRQSCGDVVCGDGQFCVDWGGSLRCSHSCSVDNECQIFQGYFSCCSVASFGSSSILGGACSPPDLYNSLCAPIDDSCDPLPDGWVFCTCPDLHGATCHSDSFEPCP